MISQQRRGKLSDTFNGSREQYINFRSSQLVLRRTLLLGAALIVALPASSQERINPSGRRIVGGERVDVRNHPWQVALDVRIDGRNYLCGGAIIAARWIVTAAHCFTAKSKPVDVQVKTAVDGKWLKARRIVIHNQYDSATHDNDIALIKTEKRLSGKVIPVATPSHGITAQQPLEVTGWGKTSEDGSVSEILLKATVPYVDNETCNQSNAYNGAVRATMLCAGFRDGGADACQGDSGGPLVHRTDNGPLLVGIVSWGEGCARKLKFGVYTRISKYTIWIARNVAHSN